ncbi:type II secretion system protein [Cellulosilyticum lentocellum]|uniref:Prepilin-type N-terminal cleavage/methylation domain-containing protein n=1 Tax=Cellulosilyticum lentocellum (strain ATCC 49066 / DSM 5427 / NCIMB 11756 / RHM5) TaxID=642492 RepID=F2JMD7_CELLD|nr:type II secretion system protein [Cellulosilyticum lentocellum]ADZ83455.1 hypothetical protein Clole_1731 [Cellulosilyticum lentocellum DSM 5427]
MKRLGNELGFTLIELIVVIAIMGIIGAVLIPQFNTMTVRARLRTDVDSVKTVQTQMEIYYADRNEMPGTTVSHIMSTLLKEDYVNPKYLLGSDLKLETRGVSVVFDTTKSQLKLKVTPSQYSIFNHEEDKSQWLSQ